MPIVLLVLAPEAGQSVGADPLVVIYVQPTLGGIDQVAYTLTLDQRPVDPDSGRHVAHAIDHIVVERYWIWMNLPTDGTPRLETMNSMYQPGGATLAEAGARATICPPPRPVMASRM